MSTKKGFTLIELLIVMAVVAILVSIIIPSFRGMQQEGWMMKADKETGTLQLAVESYLRHHHDTLPGNLTTALTGATPQMIGSVLPDPWKTDTDTGTYGFATKNITGNDHYVIFSKGINGTQDWSWASDGSAAVTLPKGSDDILKTSVTVKQE